jgi:hypothetical protein
MKCPKLETKKILTKLKYEGSSSQKESGLLIKFVDYRFVDNLYFEF